MRADRLVAILLLLQRREVVTAAEVAAELEISVRTARRDLEALAMSGVPVYSQQGRGGGWRLAGGGKLDLSGLNADEVRSLFVLAGPRADVTPEVRSALRKLVRALPEPQRRGAEMAAGAVIVDPSGWGQRTAPPWRPPMLDALESAVVDAECVRLRYRDRSGEETQRVVHPLGLATKGRSWYVVTDTEAGFRTFRVDRVAGVERTGDPVVRPEGFELSEAWARIVAGIDEMRMPLVVTGRVRSEARPYVRFVFGKRAEMAEPAEMVEPSLASDGAPEAGSDWLPIRVRASSARSVAVELAGFGSLVEIHEPEEVRNLLGEIGLELVELYTP